MAQKFNNQHYCTKGISEQLAITTQVILWELIQTMEVPVYSKEHLFPSTDPITGKIFVIDDETHSTMLFAEEY